MGAKGKIVPVTYQNQREKSIQRLERELAGHKFAIDNATKARDSAQKDMDSLWSLYESAKKELEEVQKMESE